MGTMHELGEWGLIAAVKARFGALPEGWVGIGDDTAVGQVTPGRRVLTTVDLLVEDVHFRRAADPRDVGWKSLAVNLSDIAAMGGQPLWAVLGLALPADLPRAWIEGFYDGLAELASNTGTRIVGGDTVRSPGGMTMSITVVGEVERPLLRTGMRPGDWLFATSPAGRSAAGLWVQENPGRVEASSLDRVYVKAAREAHMRPVPQLEAAKAIQRSGLRVALLDDSDGLGRSALLLAEANGLDVRLEVLRLPLDAATRAVAELAGVDPVQWALFGGEDYHLVGAVAPEDWKRLESALESTGLPLLRIGEALPGTGRVWVRDPDQQTHELTGEVGFQHF